jgi:hypothetical protein
MTMLPIFSKLSKKKTSLEALVLKHPDIWKSVYQNLKENIDLKKIDKLSDFQTNYKKEYLYKNKIDHLILMNLKEPYNEKSIYDTIMHLAIEQFLAVYTGKFPVNKLKRLDYLFFYFLLYLPIKKNKILSETIFDKRWSSFKNQDLLLFAMQQRGYWNIPTYESLRFISELIQKNDIVLEIGAGHGLLSHGLKQLGIHVTATDNFSWKNETRSLKSSGFVKKLDAGDALRLFTPKVVICSWPPAQNSFETQIFETLSVQIYLVILSKHKFASGNWEVYKNQKNFTCSKIEHLTRSLRPIEAEQELYIFRRKT